MMSVSVQQHEQVPNLPKLAEILDVLKPMEPDYFDLGVQLNLSVKMLDVIKEENHRVSVRLCKTIDAWQEKNSKDCTWSALADAVKRVSGYDNLVRELQQRGNNPPKPRTLPISDSDKDTGYSTKSDSATSDTGSESECFQLVPGCGCKEKPCSLYTLCARGCPNPSRKRIPVLQKKRAGAVTQEDLPFEDDDDSEDFERETKKINKHFGKFVTDICCSFETQEVKVDKLTLFLLSSFPVLKSRSKELNEATSLDRVFKVIVDQACSWFNYEVITEMIDEFGDSSDKDCAEKYKEQFKKYAQLRLPKGQKHIEVGSGAKVGGKQLVIKIDQEWEEVNFNKLDRLRGSFASILGVRRKDLYLADVREGCIMMTFMIHEELAKKLFPTRSCLTVEQTHTLKSESVISVKCGKLTWRGSSVASERAEGQAVSGKDKTTPDVKNLNRSSENDHYLTSTWKKIGLSILMALLLFSTVLAGASLLLWQGTYINSNTTVAGCTTHSGFTTDHNPSHVLSAYVNVKFSINVQHIKEDHNRSYTTKVDDDCRYITSPTNTVDRHLSDCKQNYDSRNNVSMLNNLHVKRYPTIGRNISFGSWDHKDNTFECHTITTLMKISIIFTFLEKDIDIFKLVQYSYKLSILCKIHFQICTTKPFWSRDDGKDSIDSSSYSIRVDDKWHQFTNRYATMHMMTQSEFSKCTSLNWSYMHKLQHLPFIHSLKPEIVSIMDITTQFSSDEYQVAPAKSNVDQDFHALIQWLNSNRKSFEFTTKLNGDCRYNIVEHVLVIMTNRNNNMKYVYLYMNSSCLSVPYSHQHLHFKSVYQHGIRLKINSSYHLQSVISGEYLKHTIIELHKINCEKLVECVELLPHNLIQDKCLQLLLSKLAARCTIVRSITETMTFFNKYCILIYTRNF